MVLSYNGFIKIGECNHSEVKMNHHRRYFLGSKLIGITILVAGFLSLTSISGVAKEVTRDVDNSQDNALISRYEGSFIIGYAHKEYSDFLLPLSAPKTWEPELEMIMRVEGEHTRIIYVAPEKRSTLEVFRNYQNELKGDNVEILFSCEQSECGKKEGQVMVQKILYPLEAQLKNINKVTEHAFTFPVDMRYLSAKITGSKEAYISIF